MRIQNVETGKSYTVSKADWEGKLKKKQHAFNVISDSDEVTIPVTAAEPVVTKGKKLSGSKKPATGEKPKTSKK